MGFFCPRVGSAAILFACVSVAFLLPCILPLSCPADKTSQLKDGEKYTGGKVV